MRVIMCIGSLVLLACSGNAFGRDAGPPADAGVQSVGIVCASGPECNDLGRRFRDGKGKSRDHAKAAQYFEAGCKKEDAGACVNLGALLTSGAPSEEAGRAQAQRALDAFQTACDRGNLDGCIDVAGLYQFGLGDVPKDPARAAQILEKTCNAGEAVACVQLAELYDTGVGVKKNKKKAAALRKLAKQKGYVGD